MSLGGKTLRKMTGRLLLVIPVMPGVGCEGDNNRREEPLGWEDVVVSERNGHWK